MENRNAVVRTVAVTAAVLGCSYLVYRLCSTPSKSSGAAGGNNGGKTIKRSTSLQSLQGSEIDTTKPPHYSFEFFPPKTSAGVKALYRRMWGLVKQRPEFIDVTWGAGGSTSDLTLQICGDFTRLFPDVEVNMHLTCTNITPEKVREALEAAKALGIRNITALRGDPPAGQDKWTSTEGGFECARDLVKHIRLQYGDYFGIAVAAYPEGHPDIIKKVTDLSKLSETELARLVTRDGENFVCSDEDFEKSIGYLKEKVTAGANCIISQLFYDVDCFVQFVDTCRAAGIKVPILPGIMPITNYGSFMRMTGFCKTRIPAEFLKQMEAVKDDEKAFKELGVNIVSGVAQRVWHSGRVPSLHFYTLNKEEATYAIMRNLDIPVIETSTEAMKAQREKFMPKIEAALKK